MVATPNLFSNMFLFGSSSRRGFSCDTRL